MAFVRIEAVNQEIKLKEAPFPEIQPDEVLIKGASVWRRNPRSASASEKAIPI